MKVFSSKESDVEPNYNDPNYWMRWYTEQHELQRARQEADDIPADQTGFAQQLRNLQLGPSEEGSADLSSPDTRPTERHGIIKRTGSMRAPPGSNLQDDAFSSMRHSVDLPRAHLRGSAARESNLDLPDRAFNSTRYTAPSEPELAAQTKDRKSRGLCATGSRAATNTARHQRRFSDWLQTTGRESIASRLNGDDEQKWSLKKDYQDFSEAVGKRSMGFKRLGQYLQVVQANAALGRATEHASGAGPAGPGTRSRSDQPAGSESIRPPQRADQPIQDRSGSALGSTQWLGDEHIHRDYGLLAQELLQSNPDLATRTRFVDPLIATQLLHGEASDALRAFHRIVNDRTIGYDTADFLFLPVNDASPADLNRRGTHWSLLFVDRRDRSGPLAYHYDSAGGTTNRLQISSQPGSALTLSPP